MCLNEWYKLIKSGIQDKDKLSEPQVKKLLTGVDNWVIIRF